VVLNGSLLKIGNEVFKNSRNLKYIIYHGWYDPQSLSDIFYGCSNLKSVFLPDTLTFIDDSAFYNCKELTSVTIPPKVESYATSGTKLFSGCKNLKSIKVDERNAVFKSIDGVLFDCLHTIIVYPEGRSGAYVIPPGTKYIESEAFKGCSGLTSVTIPSTIDSIERSTFEGCDGLATISVDENNLAYTSDNGVLLDNMGKIIQFPKGWIGNYTIPNVVTSVDERVFSNCHGLTSINISSNMINIENKAFSGCNNLERINVDDLNPVYKSVDGVLFDRENDILLECPEGFQGTINIPKGTTTIGRKAFKDCSRITAITIPSSVNEIEDNAFEGCSSISELNIEDGVKVIGRSAFSGTEASCMISVNSSINLTRGSA